LTLLVTADGCRRHRKTKSAPNTTEYADNLQKLVAKKLIPKEMLDAKENANLRWPNFSDYQPIVAKFYDDRNYEIACDAGQEQHLRELARNLDGRVRQLIKSAGPASEGRLLLMAGLLIADELHEARIELDRLQSDRAPPRAVIEQQLAETLEQLATRLESIAAQLEAA